MSPPRRSNPPDHDAEYPCPAIGTDAVDIGGLVDAVTICGDGLGGVIVTHDEEDVGTGHFGIPLNYWKCWV